MVNPDSSSQKRFFPAQLPPTPRRPHGYGGAGVPIKMDEQTYIQTKLRKWEPSSSKCQDESTNGEPAQENVSESPLETLSTPHVPIEDDRSLEASALLPQPRQEETRVAGRTIPVVVPKPKRLFWTDAIQLPLVLVIGGFLYWRGWL
jgi:hypothetical protein